MGKKGLSDLNFLESWVYDYINGNTKLKKYIVNQIKLQHEFRPDNTQNNSIIGNNLEKLFLDFDKEKQNSATLVEYVLQTQELSFTKIVKKLKEDNGI